MDDKQSGNMLFILLIAIVLLGGLAVMLSRGSSSTDDTGGSERVAIQASEIMKYSAGIGAAVSRLISKGCSENEIDFNHPLNGWASTPAAPADKSCHIFDVNGAGMTFVNAKAAWKDSAYTPYWGGFNAQCVAGIGGGSTTCTRQDLDIVFTVRGIKLEICNEINRRMGITSATGAPPVDEMFITYDSTFPDPSGSAANALIGDQATTAAAPLYGKKAGCFKDIGGGTADQYFFYQVILAR